MIIPTILEKNEKEVQKLISLLELDAKLIQIDIADETLVNGGNYITADRLSKIKAKTKLELDLRDKKPLEYLKKVEGLFSQVIIPLESDNISEFIENTSLKKGLSIRLETPLSMFLDYANSVEYVQFMSVEPGIQGRPFEYKVLEKIKEFKKMFPAMETQVDGHLTEETIPLVKALGVDNFVVGTAIVKSANPVENYKKLTKLIEK